MSSSADARRRAAGRHWRGVLPTLPRTVHWPADQLPDGAASPAEPVSRTLDEETARRVRAATRGDAVLLHAVFCAALATCLAARRDHHVVGIVVPPLRDTGDTGAPSVTALPVPLDVAATSTGKRLLPATRQALLDAYAAQQPDPGWLEEHAPALRATEGGYPLADWLVSSSDIHLPVPAGLRFHGVAQVRCDENDMGVTLTADPELFRQSTVEHLAEQVVAVAGQLLTAPDTELSELRRSSRRVREAARRAATGPACPEPVPVLERIRKVATETGGAAVTAEDGTIDYPELLARADLVARGLLAEARGGLVALMTGQTAATVVGALAALTAGLPYVVVPPDLADDPVLRERGVTVRVVSTVDSGRGARTLEQLATRGARPDAPELPADIDPDTPAYVLFTSGSTGAAKAVVVTHGNLAASTEARLAVHGSAPLPFLLLSPFHFDSSVAGLYATLACGGTLHVVPAEDLAEPAALAGHARRSAAAVTLGLPRVLEGLFRGASQTDLATMRLVIGAGEVFPAGLAELVRHAAPGARVVNEYGPSEATVWITSHDVTGEESSVPIGRPVPGSSLYVLDGWGEPLPPGMVGQLAAGGPQVAAGYLGAPELTEERFVPDRFGDPAGRLYLTGDEGWAEPDGTVYFVGRADDEVKVRGARVRLADVAAGFRARAEVGDAEVVIDNGTLTAFLVPAGEHALDLDQVLAAARPGLVGHAVPTRMVEVARIPRLANGKVDRAALLAAARRRDSAPARPPADELEAHLLTLFRTALGTDELGVEDNFFGTGGDSIKAALLIAQLSRELATYVYVVALLDHPTPAGLATFLRENYAEALARHGIGGTAVRAPETTATATSLATAAAADELRALVTAGPDPARVPPPPRRIPRAAFVLAPPRSGTTLLRTVLAGHPGLFAPPELELVQFGTLAERRAALSGRYAFYQEGLVRAVMSLRDCDADEASTFLARSADEGWTSADAYAWLVEQAGGRTLVDKTTAYGLDPRALSRIEQQFDQPRYVHLTRHPQACLRSFVEARLDQVYLRAEHSFGAEQTAELVWRNSHEQISRFLDGIEQDRVLRVAFEDLVSEPASVAAELCEFLGVDFDERMLDVHGDQRTRMTDGIRDGGRMLGDIKFHEHRGITSRAADRWRDDGERIPVHSLTLATARELGYDEHGPVRDRPLPANPRWDWLIEVMRPGTSVLNIPLALAGEGRLDLIAVERAIRTLARRHHAFRSVIVAPDIEPVLRFAPNLVPAFTVEQVRADRQAERAAELGAVPFDLEHDSPLRVHVLVDSDGPDGDRFTLLFVVHHVAADAWSLRLVARDFLAAYDDWRRGGPAVLPALHRQPADVAADEAARDPAELTAIARRVRSRLAGVEWSLNLPPAREPQSAAGVDSVRIPFGAETTAAVRRYAADRGASLYRTLLAAFGWTVHTWTGNRDFCVSTPMLNRGPLDDETVGLFITTAIVRLDLTGAVTFDELLRRNEKAVRDAIADVRIPFEDTVAALADEVGPGGSLLQVQFSAQELDLRLDRCPDLRLRHVPMRPGHAKFDLGVVVSDEGGRLTVQADLSTARFAPGSAERLVREFEATVRRLIAEPGTTLVPVSVRSPEDGGGSR